MMQETIDGDRATVCGAFARYVLPLEENRRVRLAILVAARRPLRRILLELALAGMDTEVSARRFSRFRFESRNAQQFPEQVRIRFTKIRWAR